MTGKHLPDGFHTITPYLTVEGADALLTFLKEAFDAQERECHRDGARIVHAAVRIGDSIVELADANPQWPPTPAALHMYVLDCDAVHARAVKAGATVLHEPMDQPYGERSSAVRDPAGNNWYIATFKRV